MDAFKVRWVAAAAATLVASAACGDEWAIIGPRAMGMGGAGVAVTRGGLGTYWNPAALAPPRAHRVHAAWDVDVPATFNAAAPEDVLRDVDDLLDIVTDLDFDALDDQLDAGTPLTEDQLRGILRLVDEAGDLSGPGKGLVANASIAAMARVDLDSVPGAFGFSALGLSHVGGEANVDTVNIALGDEGLDAVLGPGSDRSGQISAAGQAFADDLATSGVATQNQAEEVVFQAEQAGVDVSSQGTQDAIEAVLVATRDNEGGSVDRSITNNQSGMISRGILLQEYAVAYAYPFLDLFSLGVTAKLLHGTTYFKPFPLEQLDDLNDMLKEAREDENRESSFDFGIDAGLLVQPIPWLSLGLVGRNLNGPEFAMEGPGHYRVEPQVRAGLGVAPLTELGLPVGLVLAADIDVIENDSEALPGYQSQVVGGGAELSIGDVFALRAGVSKNLAEPEESLVLHAGLGFRFWLIQIDAAIAATPELTEIEADDGEDPVEVPERVGASLMVSVNIPLD
jgi:hypothetical protein